MMKTNSLACLLGGWLALGLVPTAQAATFVNNEGTLPSVDYEVAFIDFTFNLTTAGLGPVGNVTLTINSLTHPDLSELELYLLSPAPESSVLTLADTLNGNQLQDTLLSDAGSIFIDTASAPFTGTFKPQGGPGNLLAATTETFAGFNGEDPNGLWKLRIYDTVGNGSIGSFGGAVLDVEPVPVPPATAGLVAFATLGAWTQRQRLRSQKAN